MKLIGCVLIILLSVLIGSGLRRDIKRRLEALEALERVCIGLHSEISFCAVPVDELASKFSSDSRCGSLFSNVHLNMEKGFPDAWSESASKWVKDNGLTAEESETVLMLRALGSADAMGEGKLLDAVATRLSEHGRRAKEEINTKGRMMFSCSVLAGIALVIIII